MRRFLLALAVACGPTDVTPDATVDARGPDATVDAAPPVPCTIMLTGAITGTFGCTASAIKSDSESFTVIGAVGTPAGTVESLLFAVRVEGQPAVRDYAAGDVSAAATVTTASNVFQASGEVGVINGLQITALIPQQAPPGATVWQPHGSFSAILAGTSAPGMVTLLASF